MPARPAHSETVLATRLQARRQVIGLGRLQPLGAKEIKLFLNTTIHAVKFAWSVMTCPTTDLSISTNDQPAKL